MERRAGHEEVIAVKNKENSLPQLPYIAAFEHDDKTPKAQLNTILKFNSMRERLLILGEMQEN